MAANGHETEIKLPVESAEAAKKLLRAAGFRVHKRRAFEDNIVFDTPGLKLRRNSSLLRLRETAGKAIVTFKGKPVASKHKSREELEVEVGDAGTLRAIVERLGFRPAFRYQKYRTEYRRREVSGVATIDETPIGVYLELEGEPGWIDDTARELGYSERDYVTSSYARLFFAWRKRRRVRAADMLWDSRT